MSTIKVNGRDIAVASEDEAMPLLWLVREHKDLGLTGTKYGCGIARCGACTIHLDNKAVRSCVTPASEAIGKSVTTIEGLGETLGAVQTAWKEMNVPQCGYCQSGQIMSAVALLSAKPAPSADDVDTAMGGNLCRCGTYCAIRRAITRAADLVRGGMHP